MIQHHPGDDLLLELAAGRLDEPRALLVSTHLEACTACRARLHGLQALGGVLLESVDPVALAPGALDAVMARTADDRTPEPGPRAGATPPMDASPLSAAAPRTAAAGRRDWRPDLPAGMRWPTALRGCDVSRWHWMGPGMRWSRVRVPHRPGAALFLLRIAPGRSLARHTHRGVELTQVLHGSFDDGRAVFGPGDFDATDESIHHQPVVRDGGECVCLAYVGGRLRFDGRIARAIGGLIGM